MSTDAYFDALESDRREPMGLLRDLIRTSLPAGFSEEMQYGMPSWVVPHDTYPAGYHTKPSEPLPFLSIASQKRHIAVYHMAVYADPDLLAWFTDAYSEHSRYKLDMGKSCIRFRNPDRIPYDLMGELFSKVTVEDWIALYEAQVKKG